ncbi:hypothetical protein PMAYCL1PPCAC_21216, partial [Pristionchus mayeri]
KVLEGLNLQGKTIAITGTTSGLGAVTSRSLALAGASVLCLNRNKSATEQQMPKLGSKRDDVDMIFIECDLSSIASVRAAAEKVIRTIDHIDVLILNAGIYQPTEPATLDGLEATFGVNHVGHFHLATLLLLLLEKSAPSRIVVIGLE